MPARVQVVVEVKNVGGGVLRAITSEFGQLGNVVQELTAKNVNWGNVAEQVTSMVINGVRDSIKVTQEYAAEVRDLALSSDISAEAASRLIQTFDDYEISAQDITLATRKLKDQGLTPTIETMAELADKYVAIQDPAEKLAFLQENLGRNSQKWALAMKNGGAALLEQNAAINQSLILNDQAIIASENYRLALDEWNDSVMGLKVSIGNELLPTLTTLIDVANQTASEGGVAGLGSSIGVRLVQQVKAGEIEIKSFTDLAVRAGQMLMKEDVPAVDSATRSYTAMAKVLSGTANPALAATNQNFKNIITSAIQMGEVTDENIKKAAFNMLQMKLASDGVIDESDEKMLEKAGLAFGVIDKKSLTATKSIDKFTNQVVEGTLAIEDFIAAVNNIPTTVNINPTGGGGTRRQQGGEVFAGNAYTVAERGGEPFMPAVNGRILGHSESLRALALGSSMGGGGSYNFYGNVTLSIGEEGASGLINAR